MIITGIQKNYDPSSFIRNGLIQLGDIATIKSLIKSVNDIVRYKILLTQSRLSTESLRFFIDLIVQKHKKQNRFKRKPCILILKRLIKNRKQQGQMNSDMIDSLFYLFQQYHMDKNVNIQWAVTTMLKDQVVSSDQLLWLINNHDKSVHVLNRLIKYPELNRNLIKWANDCLRDGLYSDRLSEILALTLYPEIDIHDMCIHYGNNVVAWAIYRSKYDTKAKYLLLNKMPLEKQSEFDGYIDVCVRLDLPELIMKMKSQLDIKN